MKLRGLVETVCEKYETLRDVLSERQRRIWAATEARADKTKTKRSKSSSASTDAITAFVSLASTAVVVAGLVLPNKLPCRVAVALLLQIEYGNPLCLKIVPENVHPFTINGYSPEGRALLRRRYRGPCKK